MIILHALVNHRNNHIGISCGLGPSLPDICVSTDKTAVSKDGTAVVVVPLPLLRIFALIEREGGRARHHSLGPVQRLSHSRKRRKRVFVARAYFHRTFDTFHCSTAAKLTHQCRSLKGFVETCHIPAVKPLFPGSLLKFATFRKKPFETECPVRSENFGNFAGPRSSVSNVSRRFCRDRFHLNQEFSPHCCANALVNDNSPSRFGCILLHILL